MKKLTLIALFFACFAALSLMAQQSPKPAAVPGNSGFLADDDGGVVQIVPVGAPAHGPRKAAMVPAMKSVQQVSIFLGRGWAEAEVRTRETALLDLTSGGGSSHFAELRRHRTTILPAPPAAEDFTDLSTGAVNDLTIQSRLMELIQKKIVPQPDAATVFVVFLAPEIKSTLGPHTGGTDYAAYHSLLHQDGPDIRYVVVPFNENAGLLASAASRAMVETVFNPLSN